MSTNGTTRTAGPAISFSGLGSGIDTASIVSQLMKLERAPIDRINADKTTLNTKKGVVQEINGLLGKLRDAAAEMYKPNALAAKTASAADASILGATATNAAAAGTYNVVVTSLAQAHTLASGAAPSLTAGQSLSIGVGGTTVNVAVQAGDDLQKFADRINGTTDAGVSASVINDRLVLISKESGSASSVTVGGTAAAGFGFATTQSGTDAAATVNGLAVTSSGNVIEGAINGVSLNLTKTGATTVTVGADNGANLKKAQAFVDAYNAVVSNIKRATAYDAATQTAGTLQGDQTMSSLLGQLRGIAGSAVGGMADGYNSLAQIGITGSRDGTLTLDQAKFTAAITADPAAVQNVFGKDDGNGTTSAGDGIARQIQAFSNSFSTDIISARLTGYTNSAKRMDDRIASLEAIMDLKEQTLKAQFAAMEKAVSQFQSQGANLSSQLAAL
ncbi:MAG TPA: flagellar filament capping protein FliD [Miltoncostaeaceae bacterium]|nr:flagellar filament capping protein FliD [Miltoncostaeaceae bacterium]